MNKIVTAAAAIEYGVTNPDEVLQVPGSIRMAGVTVSDAWEHGVAPYTTTGVFGKSSNVGTLMLAQRVGEDRYADMLNRFGLGQRTDVGLPGESAGEVPTPRPVVGWHVREPADRAGPVDDAAADDRRCTRPIANDGVRIPPRIVEAQIDADGEPRRDAATRRRCMWSARRPRRPC